MLPLRFCGCTVVGAASDAFFFVLRVVIFFGSFVVAAAAVNTGVAYVMVALCCNIRLFFMDY